MFDLPDFLKECKGALEQGGLSVVTEYPTQKQAKATEPVVLLSVEQFQLEDMGFSNYLGERWNTDTHQWEECYGRKGRLTLSVQVVAPPRQAGEAVRGVTALATKALQEAQGTPLKLTSLQWGALGYKSQFDALCREGIALYEGILTAREEQSDLFLAIEVKGGMTIAEDHESGTTGGLFRL